MDNRNLLGLCLLFALVGSLLVGDWQSIGSDPCSSAALNTTSELYDFENDVSSFSSGVESPSLFSGFSSGMRENTSQYGFYERCQALSSSSHQCFWNPQSRITGEFCNTCLCVCLSEQTTINFYQFTLGILLISFATPLAFVLVSAIASDIAPVTSQVLFSYNISLCH